MVHTYFQVVVAVLSLLVIAKQYKLNNKDYV